MNQNDKNFFIRKIRNDYTPVTPSELDSLRALDKKVKRPANLFGYLFGAFSALVMGSGMSLVMTEIGTALGIADPLIPGIIIGACGIVMAAVTYPIYKTILKARKKRYASEILALTDSMIED